MTPVKLAESNTEHAHQRALFAWVQIAKVYGFVAADDPRCYTERGYVQSTYGINPRELANPSGKGTYWTDDGGRDPVPELEWLHAIPNGGPRDGFSGAILKAEGVKKGIPDLFLPVPMPAYGVEAARYMQVEYCGLYIEMKRPKSKGRAKGALKAEQTAFIGYARGIGYAASICFEWFIAARDIRTYIEAVRRAS
jgi:hypothetical protein